MATTHLVFFFLDGATASDAVAAALPEYREFGLAAPLELVGPAPGLDEGLAASDADFYALARITEIDMFLQDVADWAAAADLADGDEIVDVFGDGDPFEDAELFGRSASDRNPRRRR